MSSPDIPNCVAFPAATFPKDSQGNPDAIGQTVTIPLSRKPGYVAEATFVNRPVTGKALEILRQQSPTAPCAVEEATRVFDAVGNPTKPLVIGDNCGRCGHRVHCELRRSNP